MVMYCTRKVTEDVIWVGADERRVAMFEGIYPVPQGVSYNSYLKNATRYYYSEDVPTTSGNFWHYDENGNPVIW